MKKATLSALALAARVGRSTNGQYMAEEEENETDTDTSSGSQRANKSESKEPAKEAKPASDKLQQLASAPATNKKTSVQTGNNTAAVSGTNKKTRRMQ